MTPDDRATPGHAEADGTEVRRRRVGSQLLHRPDRRPAVADLVARLLAVQAQDIAAAPLALRARARGLTMADVAAARTERSVVRAWGPRGTLHLIAAPDLPWLLALTAPILGPGALRRLGQEGVAGGRDELLRITERALAGQGPLTKARLGERLAKLGCPATGQGIVHLAGLASAYGKVVLGPDAGTKPTYVHIGDWLGPAFALESDRDRALTELARRYLRAHAPAGPDDLAAWSGLSLRDARAGFAAIGAELVQLRDSPLWRLRRGGSQPVEVAAALLPAFDPYLLGWRDRGPVLDPAHARRIVPGGGIIRPAVVADGRIVGTWRRDRGGAVSAEFFPGAPEPDLTEERRDVVRFAVSSRVRA